MGSSASGALNFVITTLGRDLLSLVGLVAVSSRTTRRNKKARTTMHSGISLSLVARLATTKRGGFGPRFGADHIS
jgi:hypothetical protein